MATHGLESDIRKRAMKATAETTKRGQSYTLWDVNYPSGYSALRCRAYSEIYIFVHVQGHFTGYHMEDKNIYICLCVYP